MELIDTLFQITGHVFGTPVDMASRDSSYVIRSLFDPFILSFCIFS